MASRPWSYNETLLAFELYCRTPFSKICHTNNDIINLANLLGRTPSSVSMKMANIARSDPEEIARGVVGLRHGAKLEEQVWDDFNNDREDVILRAKSLLDEIKRKAGYKTIDYGTDLADVPEGEIKKRIVNTRVGQDFFRQAVLSAYDNRCCITGTIIPEFLIASHIKPWRNSTPSEKTDPHNGLCLNVFVDKAFDKGFITIDKNYCVVISESLKKYQDLDDTVRSFIINVEGKDISVPNKFRPNALYLEYHRDVIFKR